MEIQVKCKGSRLMNLGELRPFQGNLKSLSEANYTKLKGLIASQGFSFPIFVWTDKEHDQTYILDGHQRVRTLQKMIEQGYTISKIPVADVDADSFRQAKEKLMAAASYFGRVDSQGLYEFVIENDFDPNFLDENFDLPNIDLPDFSKEYFQDDLLGDEEDKDSLYTNKVEPPIYEPTGEKPEIDQLYDRTKSIELISDIDKSNVPKEIKEFLKLASYRHIVFNYENIAEFYAHADSDVQDLMEKSALVIIDFDKSIEYGFNTMVKDLSEVKENES